MQSYGWQIGDNMIALFALLIGLVTVPGIKPSQKLKLAIEQARCRLSPARK
jgi:hypothetical protein